MTTIASNLQAVRDAVTAAAIEAGRAPDDVILLAVSKTFAPEAIREAYEAGQTRFAESYVQEALHKIAALQDLPIEWHFIGPIQSNKTRATAASQAARTDGHPRTRRRSCRAAQRICTAARVMWAIEPSGAATGHLVDGHVARLCRSHRGRCDHSARRFGDFRA